MEDAGTRRRTLDADGKRGFVHDASRPGSNISATKGHQQHLLQPKPHGPFRLVYLSLMGKKRGLKGSTNWRATCHYLYDKHRLGKFEKAYDKPFLKEFVVKTDLDMKKINEGSLRMESWEESFLTTTALDLPSLKNAQKGNRHARRNNNA